MQRNGVTDSMDEQHAQSFNGSEDPSSMADRAQEQATDKNSHIYSDLHAHLHGPLREHAYETVRALVRLVRVEGLQLLDDLQPIVLLLRRLAACGLLAWTGATMAAIIGSSGLVIALFHYASFGDALRALAVITVVLLLLVAVLCEACGRAVRRIRSEIDLLLNYKPATEDLST